MLITVAHENIEVGIDHRSAVPISGLQRRGANAISLVGFGFFLRVLQRVDDFNYQIAVGDEAIFLQHVADARDKRSEKRMSLVAEVAANEQRFLHVAQQVARGLREAVFALRGQVDAHTAQREEPDIEHDQIEDDQRGAQRNAAAMP